MMLTVLVAFKGYNAAILLSLVDLPSTINFDFVSPNSECLYP